MASNSVLQLQEAVSAVERAIARLDAASSVAVHDRQQSAFKREAEQAEITRSWQQHTAQIETSLADAQSQNDFLREDNLRLSNQLQQLQQDYITLQKEAGHVVNRLDATVKQLDLILEH